MSSLIQAENLYRYYAGHCAVHNVSFSVNKGEVLGFLGPNGAGKTTTMQMLCGNLAPSSGRIRINDIDMLEQPKTAKMFLGYLPDAPPLYRELTVSEYLDYCARLHRIPCTNKKAALQKALNRCHLNEVKQRLIGNLSKGFRQRIGIAQAILHNPDVIILDEPTTGLDPIQIREIRTLIGELAHDHAILLSTHALAEVQQSCTHVQIIDQGKLILHETIAALQQTLSTATLFIATRKAVDTERLASLPDILNIETLAPGRYRIQHRLHGNPAERIAETITTFGWGLLELTPEKKSIEEVFVALTEHHGENT